METEGNDEQARRDNNPQNQQETAMNDASQHDDNDNDAIAVEELDESSAAAATTLTIPPQSRTTSFSHSNAATENDSPTPQTNDPVDYHHFLFAPAVTDQEVAAVTETVRTNLESVLTTIEERGKAVYDGFLQEQRAQTNADEATRATEERRALEHAAIVGTPRDYQTAFVEIAKKQNTIVNLGTGRGKTLIAKLCIQHFHDLATNNNTNMTKKQALFVVPSVALVMQHTDTLRANLPYQVGLACANNHHHQDSRQDLARCDIIVATHGAIHDLLMHYGDLFAMSRFHLVVLDECHCAASGKNHPYRTIMEKWYHPLPKADRPRILGLTASPLINVKHTHNDDHLQKLLDSLETILDSKLVSLKDIGVANGKDLLHKPAIERHVFFRNTHENSGDSDGDNADDAHTDDNDNLGYGPNAFPSHAGHGLHDSRHREVTQLDTLYQDIGPLAVSIYCKTLLKELTRNSYIKETRRQFRAVLDHLKNISAFCDARSVACPNGGRSDKLLKLERLLEKEIEFEGNPDAVGLVFVERRITALALYRYFEVRKKKLESKDWTRVTELMEQQADEDCDEDIMKEAPETEWLEVNNPVVPGQFDDCEIDYQIRHCDSVDQFDDADDDSDDLFFPTKVAMTDASANNDRQQVGNDSRDSMTQFHRNDARAPTTVANQFSDDKDDPTKTLIERQIHQGRSISVASNTIRCDVLVRQPSRIFYMSPNQQATTVTMNGGQYANGSHEANGNNSNKNNKNNNSDDDKAIGGEGEDDEEKLHQVRRIKTVLNSLKRQETNVLLATSMVEEGVDVQACSFVVVFDGLRTTKAYIQTKGRARQRNAKFYVFQDEQDFKSSLRDKQQAELRVLDFIENRDCLPEETTNDTMMGQEEVPTEQTVDDDEDEDDDDDDDNVIDHYLHGRDKTDRRIRKEIRAVEKGSYRTRVAFGVVDLQTAKGVLNRYSSKIPMEPSARLSRDSFLLHMPTFREDELILPAHLPAHFRVVRLPSQYYMANKSDKHKMLALMACVRLHILGLLSERLLPLSQDEVCNKVQALARDSIPPRSVCLLSYSNFPKLNGQLEVFVYPLVQAGAHVRFAEGCCQSIQERKSFAIVSLKRITAPSVSVAEYGHKEFGKVTIAMGTERAMRITEDEWDNCQHFFALVISSRWARRTKYEHFRPADPSKKDVIAPYTLGMLDSNGSIDSEKMRELIEFSNLNSDARSQSVAERFPATGATDTSDTVSPVVCFPTYNVNSAYVVYGHSGFTCADAFPDQPDDRRTMTFQDYYKARWRYDLPNSTPLVYAQSLWSLPIKPSGSDETTGTDAEAKHNDDRLRSGPLRSDRKLIPGKQVILLPISVLVESRLSETQLSALSVLLPQFLFHLDRFLTTDAFLDYCHVNLPLLNQSLRQVPIKDVVKATTSNKVDQIENYERLEWLGDAVLKLIQTDCLVTSPELRIWMDCLHEGDLSTSRSGE